MNPGIKIPKEQIAEFCRRYHMRRLAVFGSALRADFRPSKDIGDPEKGHSAGVFKEHISGTAAETSGPREVI